MKPTLNEADFQRAAEEIGCSVAAVKAVCAVEAPRGGFLATAEPTILFERHIFSRRTDSKYDVSHPEISNRTPGGYKGGKDEHERLQIAASLDRDAALSSASWGKFQIMGFNAQPAGFKDLQSFINAMYDSEAKQLDAFVGFIESQGLGRHMKEKNWAAFALRYNGKDYAKHGYHTRLAAEYKKAGGD